MDKISTKEITFIREELELNTQQFADLLDVTVRTIQRWDSEKNEIKLGRNAGTKNLQHLVEVMNNDVTKNELKKTLSKFQGTGKNASIPLISSVLDTMALITGSSLMGPIYGREIINMLENVIDRTNQNSQIDK